MILKNILLCIKYPFLWTRNRFTGLHYNNWEVIDWINREKEESSVYIVMTPTDQEIRGSKTHTLENKKCLTIEIHGKELWLVLGKLGGYFERVVSKIKFSNKIIDAVWKYESNCNGDKIIAKISVQFKNLPETKFYSCRVVHTWHKYLLSKLVNWFHSGPLQLFHCIPKSTELDALDKGWRIAFGEDLCKDLRKELKKNGELRSFRITQLKEKFGSLRLYYGGIKNYSGIEKIISKYEDISSTTCINCGKPAKWLSRGWVCPYCDDCISDKDYADEIEQKEEGL